MGTTHPSQLGRMIPFIQAVRVGDRERVGRLILSDRSGGNFHVYIPGAFMNPAREAFEQLFVETRHGVLAYAMRR